MIQASSLLGSFFFDGGVWLNMTLTNSGLLITL